MSVPILFYFCSFTKMAGSMKNRFFLSVLMLVTGCVPVSCSRKHAQAAAGAEIPGPRCIVYKTRADYSRRVPVILSADKATLLSYPDIRDVKTDGRYPYPTPLESGYLLDNRGIGPGVAFLEMTYEEYALQPETPSPGDLVRMILDKDPLVEMYDCGARTMFEDPVAEMNRVIRAGELAGKKRLK
jgi:hypothetical protein